MVVVRWDGMRRGEERRWVILMGVNRVNLYNDAGLW